MNHNIMEMELESSKCIIHCGRGGRTREKKIPKKGDNTGPNSAQPPSSDVTKSAPLRL